MLCCALVAGCGGPALSGAGRPAEDAAVRRLLDRRAQAVTGADEEDYLATVDPDDKAAIRRERRTFENLDAVPLTSWEYRLTGFDRSGKERGTAAVELRYRLDGYDTAPVSAARTVTLDRRAGRWYVTGERPAAKAPGQLWEQGDVRVTKGADAIVLGVGRDADALREYARLADRAVAAVHRAWDRPWPRRLVVLVPASLQGMASLLGAPASDYRGIAAVTTGEVGGTAKTPADRIVVNPEAYGVLGDLGKQVVLTHEATHVATRAQTSAATPLWLSEGFADWSGYRGTGRTAAQAAPELHTAVRSGRLPAALPDDKEFGFASDADRLAQAYEGGWLACRMIAEQWGEAKLRDFYAAVGAHEERTGAVEAALRDVLGTGTEEFTAQWRDYVREQLGS
ncbi:hypothetical protein GBW32_08870 [Streptomyces tsukubensis]|nr:hypothetical protein GBW32_08870 [Streptomyces tsukubensis]